MRGVIIGGFGVFANIKFGMVEVLLPRMIVVWPGGMGAKGAGCWAIYSGSDDFGKV